MQDLSILFLLLISLVTAHSYHSKEFMNSTQIITTKRQLHDTQLPYYQFTLNFSSDLYNYTYVVTIKPPCLTPEDPFHCEFPLESSNLRTYRQFYTLTPVWASTFDSRGPASINVAYLNKSYVLEYMYSNLEFSGTPTIRQTNLSEIHTSTDYASYYFHGYILPPQPVELILLVEHSGECVVWLDGQEYIREERPGLRETKGKIVYFYDYVYFQATLKNSGGLEYRFRLFWNILGTWSLVTGEYLYYPSSLSYAPFMLPGIQSYYCELGVNNFNCKNCGYLCLGCQIVNSEVICFHCRYYTNPKDNSCGCQTGYVQNPQNLNECTECPALCDSCYFIGNNEELECEVCVENAELVNGVGCRCKVGYYKVSESNFICKPYYNLCTSTVSQGSSEELECKSCTYNAVARDNQCYCDAGYYQIKYGNQCQECGSACQACEIRRLGPTCNSCIEGATLYHIDSWYYYEPGYHNCRCDDGFYAMRPLGCLKCPEMCKTCDYYSNPDLIYCNCVEEGSYYIHPIGCFKCPYPCKDCFYDYNNENTGCRDCEDGFYLTYEYKCAKCPFNLCKSCWDRYYYPYPYPDYYIYCQTCQENASLVGEECICNDGYYNTSQNIDKCMTCDGLCKVCILDVNENIVCESCIENADFIEGICQCIDRYTEPIHSQGSCVRCTDRLCLRCTQYVASQICNQCVENGIMVDGECRCREGFLARTDEDICSPCTTEFCKLCDEVECKECFSPTFLNDDGICICPSENYHIVDQDCIPKDFTSNIYSLNDNILEIKFSVPPLNAIKSSDYSIEYSIPSLSSLLSSALSKLSSTLYSITFSSTYRLEINSTITITFKDSVEDAIYQSLSPKIYSTEVRFYSSSDCIPINQLKDCNTCSSSNSSSKSCSRCDSSCRCVDASWDTCSEIEPILEAATWNSDMLRFTMTFNIPIQASSISNNDCSHYFNSSSISQLGISPICTISQDLSILTVTIGTNCSLTIGSNISLSSQISSAYNSNKRYSNTHPESITLPSHYPNPTAVLSTPSIISDCNDLKADGTQSFGNRRELKYKWSVSGDHTESISNINNFLKSESGGIITIPNSYLNNLTTINITLTVTNAFEMSHSTTSTISISNKFVPEVILQGGPGIEIVTTAAYSPQVTLKWPVCKTPPNSYSIEWSLNPIPETSSTRKLQSSSNNRQSYTITPGMLKADISYNLTATVKPETTSKDALPASSSQIIEVLPAPMFVSITRGNRQASIYKDAVLDGSLSTDASYPDLPLSYKWDCIESNTSCDFMKDLNTTTSKELFIPAGWMKSDKNYNFTLTVSNSKRSSSTSAYLQTLNSTKIPEVYLFTYESTNSTRNINYLNPNYIVLANNEISQVKDLKLQWRITPDAYILNSPSNQRSISIREGSLTYGIYYTFSLEVNFEDYISTSSITLYVNNPPIGGIFNISPSKGKELDIFTFITTGWTDVENNIPIRYELYKEVDELWVKVIDLNYATIYEGKLSAGSEKYQYSTTYHIKAYDSLGAYSNAKSSVIVEPIPQEKVESIAFETINSLSQNKEVIENLDSIPYTVITLSDSISRFETDDNNKEKRVSFVQDCLDLLSYYSEQDIESSKQAASVISTLERLTIQPSVVNEYSRNETVRMLSTSITKNEGNFKSDSVQQAVETATNLYLSTEQDNIISNSTKNSNSISYYNILNNLGLAVVKNNIRNQEVPEIITDIYKVLYQRVGPSTVNKNFTLPDGQIVFPSSFSDDLLSQNLSDNSVIDLSFIYSQQNSFTNYSRVFNESLYNIKNAGVMYVDVKRIGYEDNKGGVVYEAIETIELKDLEYPIEIYITAEYINITDQIPQCVYLNENSMEWENSGCRYKEQLKESSQIVCECYHMSYYSVADFKNDLIEATDETKVDDLNPKRFLEARFEDFYSVLIVMTLILLIHIGTSVYAFILDRKDKRAPIELFYENEASRFEVASNLSFKMNRDENTRLEDINLGAGKSPKSPKSPESPESPKSPMSPKPVHPIQTQGLYMVYQEVEMQRKSFAQLFVLKHKLLELRYVRNHSLSKLSRLSLLFYAIYANIFVLGFFYSIEEPKSFQDQLKQMAEAMEFDIKDVILFVYTKLIVLAPLIILRWLLTRNLKTLEKSVKNWIGIVLIVIGYIGSLLGILLLGINFTKYAIIMWMLKAIKAVVIDVMILSHINAFVKACIFYLIQKHKLENEPDTSAFPDSIGIPDRV